eukprot:1150373-Pelagomonas_calceolata.AAC.5
MLDDDNDDDDGDNDWHPPFDKLVTEQHVAHQVSPPACLRFLPCCAPSRPSCQPPLPPPRAPLLDQPPQGYCQCPSSALAWAACSPSGALVWAAYASVRASCMCVRVCVHSCTESCQVLFMHMGKWTWGQTNCGAAVADCRILSFTSATSTSK